MAPPMRTLSAEGPTASTSIKNRATPFKPPGPARSGGANSSDRGGSSSSGPNNSNHASRGSSHARYQTNANGNDAAVNDDNIIDDDEFGTALDLEMDMLDDSRPTTNKTTQPGPARPSPRPTTTKQPQQRPNPPAQQQQQAIPLSSHDFPSYDDDDDDDDDIALLSQPLPPTTATRARTPAPPTMASSDIPGVPAPLLTRIMHEHLSDKDVGVSRAATALMRRYVDIFVRESVARAAEGQREESERRQGDAGQGGKGKGVVAGGDDVWLDVEDLERITPGMVLDF